MKKQKAASTMSVPEMRRLLGIQKTDSYWLIKKHLFETILYNGEIRIVKSSFESWYAKQDHYHKVSGEEPGKALHKASYTVQEIADLLGISCDSVRNLIRKHNIPYSVDQQNQHTFRINKRCFDQWLATQTHYRPADLRENDQLLFDISYSIPEMGRKIGIDRRDAYKLAYRLRSELVTITIADKKRITIESFEQWYQSQTEYEKVSERAHVQSEKKADNGELLIQKASYTIREAAEYLQMEERQIFSMILEGTLEGRKVGKSWRISYDCLCEQKRRNGNGFDY